MTDPIPATLWQRIKDFLAAQKSGHITLHINSGDITGYEVTEKGKVKENGTT